MCLNQILERQSLRVFVGLPLRLTVGNRVSERWRACPSLAEPKSCGEKDTGFGTLRTSRPDSAVFQLCGLEQATK